MIESELRMCGTETIERGDRLRNRGRRLRKGRRGSNGLRDGLALAD